MRAMPRGEEALRSPFCPCCSEESYTVMNYAMLDQVSVEKVETTEPPSPPPGRPGAENDAPEGGMTSQPLCAALQSPDPTS